jgi:ankyrin repeat protein
MTEMLSSGSEESQSDDSQEIGNREPEKGDSPNPNNQKITFGGLLKLAKEKGLNFVSEYDEPHFVKYSKATDSKDTVKIKLDQEYWNLHRVSVENRVDIAHVLIARGADVDARSPYERTPLHYAARNDSLDLARLLLDHGADVDARTQSGETPLHHAAGKNSLGVTRLLIDHGAQIDARLNWDRTPLHNAAQNDSLSVARLLIKLGAEVDARTEHDETPLFCAIQRTSLDVARLLLDHGAEVDARCYQDRTPFFWAKSLGAASLLIEYGAKPVETDTSVLTTPRPTGSSDPSATTWEVLMIPKKRRGTTRKDSSQDSSADPQQQAQE